MLNMIKNILKMKNIYLLPVYIVFFVVATYHLAAQNTRLNDNSTIGWFSLNSTLKFSSKISISSEYHWRRVDLVNKWQLGLWRSCINYQIHPKVQLRLGYGLIENFPYGTYPINS